MNETILLVDDTPTNLQVLVRFLAEMGYRALLAEDGTTAIEQAIHTNPDIILLDITMPGLDGFETCRRLKQLDPIKETPIIFMTARSDITDKLKGFNAGAVDYVTKPFQKEEVIARVNTQLTLLRQKRELQQMLEQRNRFMRMAAHDLRNPLSIITGWAELGLFSAADEENRKLLSSIAEAAKHMGAIIEDFLDLNVLQNQIAGGRSAFDLQPVIAQVVEQQGFAAKEKNIVLTLRLPQGALPAHGNVSHTHQILTNYLSNAVKYSPPQTETIISAARLESRWRVQVHDHGPGIAPHEREKLFVEFAKTSNKPTGGEKSTGLGLSIVKALAEAQGGRVGAEFPAEGGSVFWVEIPAATARVAS